MLPGGGVLTGLTLRVVAILTGPEGPVLPDAAAL